MHYEHRLPVAPSIRRHQLWQGLVLRAEAPLRFVPGLTDCRILQRSAAGLVRELHYGDARVRDSVRLFADERIVYEVPRADGPADTLEMRIEEPGPSRLYVRFLYRVRLDDTGIDRGRHEALMQSAYRDNDQLTLDHIKALADAGELDTHLK